MTLSVEASEVGSQSLVAAARFAIAVLEANVRGERDAKLTYTALKYLEQNVVPSDDGRGGEGIRAVSRSATDPAPTIRQQPSAGTWLGPLTAREARLLLDNLDNLKAAGTLEEEDYKHFWSAKLKLVDIEVAGELKAEAIKL
jgi:hypothetical protein